MYLISGTPNTTQPRKSKWTCSIYWENKFGEHVKIASAHGATSEEATEKAKILCDLLNEHKPFH